MAINWLALAVAALIPLLVGAVWYNPSIGFGKAWMSASGMTDEKAQTGNMPLIFGLTYVLGFFVALVLQTAVIHQIHLFSVVANEPGVMDANSEIGAWLADFMGKYGSNFRTFKHGVFHGILEGVMIALPIIAILALFERRSFKYIAVHAGYWIVGAGPDGWRDLWLAGIGNCSA